MHSTRKTRTAQLVAIPLLALALLISPKASAVEWIRGSHGGEVTHYLARYLLLRESGERVIIDGPCLSACTLVLSIIPDDKICVTHRAVLGFHAARLLDKKTGRTSPATEATHLIEETYPPAIQAWIERHGGLSRQLLLLRGRELAALYRSCNSR
jgi:hypothetical protein